ncbi:hypothetical protein cyc_04362 [Cyclospora cayetanensis]|uniref:Uncharacterized protein n=1 Tax=Cyclospora cayetanensis TaxID=88456 RepID=A0A1D3CU36_9EIME|nr:hypothetical protein cyc_04362 [Cyclospora cayetanensis]
MLCEEALRRGFAKRLCEEALRRCFAKRLCEEALQRGFAKRLSCIPHGNKRQSVEHTLARLRRERQHHLLLLLQRRNRMPKERLLFCRQLRDAQLGRRMHGRRSKRGRVMREIILPETGCRGFLPFPLLPLHFDGCGGVFFELMSSRGPPRDLSMREPHMIECTCGVRRSRLLRVPQKGKKASLGGSSWPVEHGSETDIGVFHCPPGEEEGPSKDGSCVQGPPADEGALILAEERR